MQCISCKYDVGGLAETSLCPECGTPIENTVAAIASRAAAINFTGESPKSPSQRVILNVLMGVLVTGCGAIVLPPLASGPAARPFGALMFPFLFLATTAAHGVGSGVLLVGILQFPVYGLLIGLTAPDGRRRRFVVRGILAAHMLAATACVAMVVFKS